MRVSLPHADDVDGNLIVASESLALLGWAAPAALTARVAIERGLIELVEAHGMGVPERASAGDLANMLYHRRKPLAPYLGRCTFVYGKLSAIAHGGDVKLSDGVELIEQAAQFVEDWRMSRQCLADLIPHPPAAPRGRPGFLGGVAACNSTD